MMRRTMPRLKFNPKPLIAPIDCALSKYVDATNVLEQLVRRIRLEQSTILLRSEPQSGKTSLVAIAQSTGGLEYLRTALGNQKLQVVQLNGPEVTLEKLKMLSDPNVLLFIDEAHHMYDDVGVCDFIKSYLRSRLVLVGTASSNSSVKASTPFDVDNYYLAPAFAKDTELIPWAETSFREMFESIHQSARDDAVSRATDSLLSLCGRRVGIAAYIGSKFVSKWDDIKSEFEFESKSWARFHRTFNRISVEALQGSRVMTGLNGNPSTIGSRLLALVAVERVLPKGIFNSAISHHRQAFPQATLRMVAPPNDRRGESQSRFADSDNPLTLIANADTFTAVHPLKSQLLVLGLHPLSLSSDLRIRLKDAREEAFRLPVVVDEPTTALDALLMSISHVSLMDVLCPRSDGGGETNRYKHLTKYRTNGMPYEVAGFQDALKDAMCSSLCATLGWRVDNAKRPQKEQIDVVLNCGSETRFAVEILTDVSTNSTTLRKHIMRFADGYAGYMNDAHSDAVVWAVVDTYGPGTSPLDQQLKAMEFDTRKAFTDTGKRCPLVLSTSFHHGLFCWKCTVHEFHDDEWMERAAFDLDLDGIRMRRSKDGTGIVQAQRLDRTIQSTMWEKYGQGNPVDGPPHRYRYHVVVKNDTTTKKSSCHLSYSATVGDLLDMLGCDEADVTVRIPKYTLHNAAYEEHVGQTPREDWYREISNYTPLPFTTFATPIEVVMKKPYH